MTTTAKQTRRTFAATSPFTGETYTRTSHRGYTHAVIAYMPAETYAAQLDASAQRDRERAALYTEIADCLEAGTAPAAGSTLLAPARGMSYAEQQAGVKTEWDSVRFRIDRRNQTVASEVAVYREMADREANDAIRSDAEAAEIRANGTFREAATFHHSATLAANQVAKDLDWHTRQGWTTTIVEAPEAAPKATKRAK